MFKGKKAIINPSTTDTLIGEGTIIEGTLTSEASLRIEGHVNGDILCSGDVIIGEGGVVNSDVSARNIINAGIIQGNITTKEILTITSTGRVQGNITARSLVIAEGGTFQGTSKMEPRTHADKKDTVPLKQKDAKEATKEQKEKAAG